jgi:hypothetical protein
VINRKDVDGHDREAVFSALRSFDHTKALSEEDLFSQTFSLMDLSGEGLSAVRDMVAKGDLIEAAGKLADYFQSRAQPYLGSRPTGSDTADEVLENIFTFYGERHSLGADIDWEHNPGTGHWVHDLNRFSYLRPLVGAYFDNEDRRYGDKAVGLIQDWIGKTDVCDAFVPKKSPHVWMSYLNIQIHVSVWAEALEHLFLPKFVSETDLMVLLKSVHDQLAYLEIVIPEQNSNWVVFGATGMLKTCLFFPELRDSERWFKYAWDRFEEQLGNQVLPDGVQFELTPHYHYGVARSYMVANHLSQKAGKSVPEASRDVLRKMVHYLHQTVTPDRLHLSFNDSDPNCGEGVESFVTSPDTLAACGVESSRVADSRTFEDLPCEAFPCAGVYFLREKDLYMAFDGGPYGAHHQHEDKLSFWLAAFGRTLIVDPGRYLYDNTTPFRGYLMRTRAHNTIIVDGEDQCSKPHRDIHFSREPLDNFWDESSDRVRVSASYDLGYGSGGEIKVTHRRSVTFAVGKYWILLDELVGEGEHDIEARFQFMPGEVEVEDGRVRTMFDDANVMVCPAEGSGLGVRTVIGQEEPRGGWYSAGYNLIEPAPQAEFSKRTEVPFEFATLLLPYEGINAPDVKFYRDGSNYLVEMNGKRDVFSGEELRCVI